MKRTAGSSAKPCGTSTHEAAQRKLVSRLRTGVGRTGAEAIEWRGFGQIRVEEFFRHVGACAATCAFFLSHLFHTSIRTRVDKFEPRVTGALRLAFGEACEACEACMGKRNQSARVRPTSWLIVAVAVLPLACGSDDGGGGATATGDCAPGNTRACVGPGQCAGGQLCGADGRWAACDCGSSGAGGVSGSGAIGGNGGAAGIGGSSGTNAAGSFEWGYRWQFRAVSLRRWTRDAERRSVLRRRLGGYAIPIRGVPGSERRRRVWSAHG